MPTLRPASLADVPAVLALFERFDLRELGAPNMTAAGLAGALSVPGTEAVLLEDGPRLLGYADLMADGQAETVADALSDHRELLEWVLRRARERDLRALEHWTGPREDSPVAALLADTGFVHARTAWLLSRSGPADSPALPEGVALHPFSRERDARAVHALLQRAFAGTFGSREQPFEDWSHRVLDQGADVLCLVEHDQLVAVATHQERHGDGHIGELAVDPHARGRGFALALLHQAFCRDAALDRATTLGVDGENAGARRLYEKAGMRVVREFRRWELDVPA